MTTPQVQNDLIISTPYLYVYGFNITTLSGTTLSITAGQCRDSTNNVDMGIGTLFPPGNQGISITSPITLNAGINGYNGLDTGALAASTSYAIYIIGDSSYKKPVGAIMTLSSNSVPRLPLGYDSYRFIGSWTTDSFSLLLAGVAFGNGNDRQFRFYNGYQVVTNGTATTSTPVNVTPPLPFGMTSASVLLDVSLTPTNAGNSITFRPSGSSASTTGVTGVVAAVKTEVQAQVIAILLSGNLAFDYIISGTGGTTNIFVLGYQYSI